MKTTITSIVTSLVLLGGTIASSAQGTAFTYQGQLMSGGGAANGTYNLACSLFATNTGGAVMAGPVTNNAVNVTNGLFTVTLDFGPGVFTGAHYWLDLAVRTNGGGAFAELTPRQPLTPSPYAIFAESAGSAETLSGVYSGAVDFSNPANIFDGNGAGVTNVNAVQLDGLAASHFWQTAGNAGTSPVNGNFVGTTDNQPLELRVNGTRAFRLEPTANGAPNILGGSVGNWVMPGAVGSTIAGGGTLSNGYGAVETNSIAANYAFIGGGGGHTINTNANYALVAGGQDNLVDAGSVASAIVGGQFNSIFQNTDHSFIGGGYFNIIIPYFGSYDTIGGGENNAVDNGAFINDSTIAGGNGNQVQANSATVGGGLNNTAAGYAATVPGGASNLVSGSYAFAAGFQAEATNDNSFVWSDGSTNTVSTTDNQFVARAGGGFVFYSGAGATGVSLAPGSGSWSAMSDRDAKNGFAPVNPQSMLDRVAALPLTTWSYRSEQGVRHVGPMAQDFYHAFGVGEDDRHIAEVDESGVALAAIQGLNQKLEEKETEIAELKRQLAELKVLVKQSAPEQTK